MLLTFSPLTPRASFFMLCSYTHCLILPGSFFVSWNYTDEKETILTWIQEKVVTAEPSGQPEGFQTCLVLLMLWQQLVDWQNWMLTCSSTKTRNNKNATDKNNIKSKILPWDFWNLDLFFSFYSTYFLLNHMCMYIYGVKYFLEWSQYKWP